MKYTELSTQSRIFPNLGFFGVLSLSLLGSVSCGKTSQTAPPPAASQISPVPASSLNGFSSSCAAQGGTLITVAGRSLCHLNLSESPGVYSYSAGLLPIINPNNPVGIGAVSTNLTVKKGDLVHFTGVSQWGAVNINTYSFLGGFFNFQTINSNCALLNGQGQKVSQSTSGANQGPTNEGQPAGLFLSDKIQSYYVGNSSVVTIENNGVLQLGINVPAEDVMTSCGEIEVIQLRVERCIDATGTAYACS
jgi:hypothetical protein